MIRHATLGLTALLMLTETGSGASPKRAAGLWEETFVTTGYEIRGLKFPSRTSTSRICVREGDPTDISPELSNKLTAVSQCYDGTLARSGGSIIETSRCWTSKGKYDHKTVYSGDFVRSYDIKAYENAMGPERLSYRRTGRRVGDCTGGK